MLGSARLRFVIKEDKASNTSSYGVTEAFWEPFATYKKSHGFQIQFLYKAIYYVCVPDRDRDRECGQYLGPLWFLFAKTWIQQRVSELWVKSWIQRREWVIYRVSWRFIWEWDWVRRVEKAFKGVSETKKDNGIGWKLTVFEYFIFP